MQIDIINGSRQERVAYLAQALAGLYTGAAEPAPTVGGRQAALQRLQAFDGHTYAATRNQTVRRGVSALSPYIRHGVLGLAELRDYVLVTWGHSASTTRFVNELAWRAFWQQVYAEKGNQIYAEIEGPKYPRAERTRRGAAGLPADILSASTGLVCIDEALRELYQQGYMHNHARMWFAAYLQHWRGEHWRDGADLFYQHLLDGDPASNTLSWQWVGSTFSHKPYYFNRENVEKFSDGAYCARCPLAQGGCPFDASYEHLALHLFGLSADELRQGQQRLHSTRQRHA